MIQSGDPNGSDDGTAVQASQDRRLLVPQGRPEGPLGGHKEAQVDPSGPQQARVMLAYKKRDGTRGEGAGPREVGSKIFARKYLKPVAETL